MKETQQKIKEYKEKLPRMRERVLAVLLLLSLSASMLVTVTFAWVSLSTSPAVTGVNTSIASNGNLEIALASGTASRPNLVAISGVGDSNLPLLERNITWGNLINLSDPAYGLDSLVLRPAILNDSNLAQKPLRGPIYDATGRVIDLNPNFGYAKLNEYGQFVASDELGIRAITSMVYGDSGESTAFYNDLAAIESANGMLIKQYQAMAENTSYMNALTAMLSGYIVENIYKIYGSDLVKGQLKDESVIEKAHVQQFRYMYSDMIGFMKDQAQIAVSLLNLSAKLEAYPSTTYPIITVEELLAMPYSTANKTAYKALKNLGFKPLADGNSTVTVTKEIDQFLADYHILVEDYARLQVLFDSISGTSVNWVNSVKEAEGSEVRLIDAIIKRLMNVDTCTIGNKSQSQVAIRNSGGGSILSKLIGSTCETKITNGVLLNFDNRTGGRIANKNGPLAIKAGSYTLNSNVSTTATDNYFENERAYLYDRIGSKMQSADLIAQDVYGFAVDFWIRTNAQGSFLTLQGNVLTRTETKEVFGKNREGEEVPLYTITVTQSEGDSLLDKVTITYDIYESTKEVQVEGSNETQTVACWRYAERHSIVEDEYVSEYTNGKKPPRKIETVKIPIGYEGDNRVWEGDEHTSLTVNSSTQGSGSCYVFYADPVEQKRIKELLRAMKVTFFDDQGQLLATAYLNVDLSYESTGKVIVPLVLDENSINLGTDKNGDPIYAITALEKNTPKRITAVFYLDGEHITNSEVLASADISGQMNIQFGSSAMLKPMGNDPLYNSEVYINAELEGDTEFDYGVDQNMTTTVKVSVAGTEPSKVEAYFIRKINETQGSQETVFTLQDADGDGVWEGTYTFRYPGKYILRSIRVDGTDRDLQITEGESYPTVVVSGYSVTGVRYIGVTDGMRIMTDASTYSVTSELTFATNDPNMMPKKVVGQFMREDGAVASINYAYDATDGVWRGKTTFVSTGEYTMQFVMLDGVYTELSEAFWCTVDLTLGMRVRVTTVSPTTFAYDPETMPEALYMGVEILDNNGDPAKNITGARLYYAASGSSQLYTDLRWNDSTGRYEGEFDVQAGIWKFDKVVVYAGEQTNNLKTVNTDAPVFTIIPPTPPTFSNGEADGVQFVKTGTGTAKATLRNSEAATVYAKFVRRDTRSGGAYYVVATGMAQTGENLYTYTFGLDSGLWELVSVSAFNVIDSNMIVHALPTDGNGQVKAVETEEEYMSGMVFDLTTPLSAAVLLQGDVNISISYAGDAFDSVTDGAVKVGNFGKNSSGNVTSAFMDSHSIAQGAMTVRFSDTYGLIGTVFTVTDITLYYDFEKTPDATYGGYTSAESVWTSFSPGKLSFTAGDTPGAFTNSAPINFQYAGRYAVENATNDKAIDFTVSWTGADGSTKTANASQAPNGAYAVEVWSKAIAVNITAVTPNTQVPTRITYTSIGSYTLTEEKTNAIDAANNSVTAYAKASTSSEAPGVSTGDAGFVCPTVTFAALGVDSTTKISFTIPKGSSTKDISVSLTGTTGGTYTLGSTKVVDEKSGCVTNTVYGYYGHNPSQNEKVRISSVTVVYKGFSFEAQLEKAIVIDNPSSVNQK